MESNAEIVEDTNQYYLSFKIIVIGDSNVGKTCLTGRAAKDKFNTRYSPTIGFEFLTLCVKIDNRIVKLQIWDTCGQEIYRSLIKSFYRNASLAMIVYSIDSKKSFNNINEWMKDVKMQCLPNVRIFLIGNKNDLEDKRKVSFDKGKNFCKVNEFHLFMETSAKSGFNAKKLFINAAKLLYKDFIKLKNEGDLMKLNEENLLMKERKNLKLGNNNEEQSSYGCC